MQVESGISVDQEEEECDKMQSNHEVALDEIVKRLSCFAYMLQLVVNKFIDRVVLQVLVSAHTLVNKLSSAYCARLLPLPLLNRCTLLAGLHLDHFIISCKSSPNMQTWHN